MIRAREEWPGLWEMVKAWALGWLICLCKVCLWVNHLPSLGIGQPLGGAVFVSQAPDVKHKNIKHANTFGPGGPKQTRDPELLSGLKSQLLGVVSYPLLRGDNTSLKNDEKEIMQKCTCCSWRQPHSSELQPYSPRM